jgi:hypothetical protein
MFETKSQIDPPNNQTFLQKKYKKYITQCKNREDKTSAQ